MRIAFLGWAGACDPMRIGGTESVARRLAIGLSHKGHVVAVVMYGAGKSQELHDFFGDPMILQYHQSFSDALRGIDRLNCDVVIELYIHKRYYLEYLIFKKWNSKTTRFYVIFMSKAVNGVKRYLRAIIRRIFCTTVFAVSPDMVKELKRYGIAAVWLPPPVPDCYFSSSRESPKTKTVVSFLGRIDLNKGLYELCSVFDALSWRDRLDLQIKGYYFSDVESVKLHSLLQRVDGIAYSADPHSSSGYDPSKEQEIMRYLSKTDILVLPYRNLKGTLALPLIVIEGLAANCLVISRDISGIGQIIGRSELTIQDFGELKEKLEKFSDPGTLEDERSKINKLNLFSTFAMTNVVEKLIRYC